MGDVLTDLPAVSNFEEVSGRERHVSGRIEDACVQAQEA